MARTGEPTHKRSGIAASWTCLMVNQREARRPSIKVAINQLVKEREGEEQALYVCLLATNRGCEIRRRTCLETKHITNETHQEVGSKEARNTTHHKMLEDKNCGLSRCRLAPGRCGVRQRYFWRQTRSIVCYRMARHTCTTTIEDRG